MSIAIILIPNQNKRMILGRMWMVDVDQIVLQHLTYQGFTQSNGFKYIEDLNEIFDIKNGTVKIDTSCLTLTIETGIEPLFVRNKSQPAVPGYERFIIIITILLSSIYY